MPIGAETKTASVKLAKGFIFAEIPFKLSTLL